MSTVLITGAATGIGNLTAKTLARQGYTVYASMRGLAGRNAEKVEELTALADAENIDLRVVELDVTSQDSANAAEKHVFDEAGSIDVVVQNAGHLYVALRAPRTSQTRAGPATRRSPRPTAP